MFICVLIFNLNFFPLDAFLRSRSDNDHEATVMMKTQFMTFWDGLGTDNDSQILIMGATNRPDAVDSAILRRMPSKFHVPLPVSGDISGLILIHSRSCMSLNKLPILLTIES